MRFIRSPHRDARILKSGGTTTLATTGQGHDQQPNVRAGTTSVATNYGTLHTQHTSFDFSAGKQYGAGVFIRGPGNDGDLFKFYRVIITACTFDDHLHPMAIWGIGPASISVSLTGNQLTNFQHIGASIAKQKGNSLIYDDLVKVAPFTGASSSRSICFGVVIYNDSATDIDNGAYNYNISVLREGGEVPDALARHDL